MQISFKKNAIFMVAGNAVYAGCQWLVLVAISQFGEPLDVGNYALGLAIVGPIFILSNMGLRQVITTDVKNEWNFSDYFRLRIQSLLIGLIFVLSYIILFRDWNYTALIIFLLGISKCVESILDIYYGYFQKNHRFDLVSSSRIITGLLGSSLFITTFYFSNEIEWAILALVFGWFLSSILIGRNKISDIENNNKPVLPEEQVAKPLWDKKLFLLALPLGWSSLLISLRTNIPRYFVEVEVGTVELGVFAITAYLIHLLGIVVAALGGTACPRMAEYYANKNYKHFLKTLYALLFSAFILGTIGLLASIYFGREILSFFYGSEYAEYYNYLNYMMIIGFISYICGFLNYAMEALRIFKKNFLISLISTLVCLVSCYLLVESHGILGACIGWFLGLFTQAALSTFYIYKKCLIQV